MKPLTKLERASMPLEPGEGVFMLVIGGGGACIFFLAVRELSTWLISHNLGLLIFPLWIAAGGLALYVIYGWLKPEGE